MVMLELLEDLDEPLPGLFVVELAIDAQALLRLASNRAVIVDPAPRQSNEADKALAMYRPVHKGRR